MKLLSARSIDCRLIFAFLVLQPFAQAQNPNLVPRTLPIQVNADDGDTWKSDIAYLSQSLAADEIVILVARPGNREYSQKLVRERLRVARMYLLISRGLEPALQEENIVTAHGERVIGPGRIDAYVRGKLFARFVFKRNKNFSPEP